LFWANTWVYKTTNKLETRIFLISNLVKCCAYKRLLLIAAYPTHYAGMELELLSAGTVAKFIIISSLLILLFNEAFSAGTMLKHALMLIVSTSTSLA
jgi:hypothetical protein